MKKTILIIISLFFIISCENENFDDNINLENISNNKNNLNQNRYAEEDSDILAYKLKIVAYITGRVLLNSPRARGIVINQLQNRNSISFNELFYPGIVDMDSHFKNAFIRESSFFEGRPTSHRPIPPITDGRSAEQNLLTENPNTLFPFKNNNRIPTYSFLFTGGVHEFVETSCFELYFAKPFDLLQNNHLYISNHPLVENEEIIESYIEGFNLWNDIDNREAGEYIYFDEELFISNDYNILVVRPYRTDSCHFEKIVVTDFTDFYKY